MTRPLTPECRLIFRTADLNATPAELSEIASAVTDWSRVIGVADRELATSQLARALHGSAMKVPADVLEVTRRKALAIEVRMQFLARRIQGTSAVFAERGIPFMLLKGAGVAALVDPTFCSRPMNDVDILVKEGDVARATEAIEASGWEPTRDHVLRELLAEAHHLPPFLDPQMPGIRVELHNAHLPETHPFVFDAPMLWSAAQPAPMPFAGAVVPSDEHFVLHASLHFAWQHAMAFGAWRTFRLISMVTRLPAFNWDSLTRAAIDARAATSCYWTLRLAGRLSGIAVPPEVLQRLAPPTPEWVRTSLERHFVASVAVGETPASPSVLLDHALWLAAIRPRWSGHPTSRHWDHENRWGQAYGVASTESAWRRVVRHLTGYRRWTAFLTRTLAG